MQQQLVIKKSQVEQQSCVCSICNKELQIITQNHLRLHNLTMAEYRAVFPEATIISSEWLKKRKKPVFHRNCRMCGRPFDTTNPRQQCCDKECSLINHRQHSRLKGKTYRMRRRNNGKNSVANGTFGENYLEITSEGRVKGAWLLEHKIPINGSWKASRKAYGKKPPTQTLSLFSKFNYLALRGKIYCSECWEPATIIIAKANKYYTMSEPCCNNCGLVIDATKQKLWVS